MHQGINADFQSCHQHPSLPNINLLKVTAFTVSVYSCVYRPYVPFKSLAGETSEVVAPDYGIRAIGEKVSDRSFCLIAMA